MNQEPLKVRIKLLLKKILPVIIFSLILKIWRSTLSKISSSGDTKIVETYTKEFLAIHGYSVVGGPFKGMKYIHEAAGSGYLIKLIGVYEEVLHPIINLAVSREYTTMIDIGCAEGYYLVGIGMKSKKTKLVGYDIDKKALDLTKELYTLNRLTNELLLLEDCTPKDLNSRIDDKTFLICDAEGFEEEILNPTSSPALLEVQTLLIELHEFVVPNVKKVLIHRFEKTHSIETVVFKNGNPNNYPFLKKITNKTDLYTLLRERGEQEQEWLILEKR
ncbi:MAG: hypothetical protein WC444_02160 [Candidatus Paceibacterota bacterium]